MKKRYLIVPLLTLLLTSNVYAITSNDVTYDNNGTTEILTDSMDNLYSELKKYKTGGSVAANQMLEGATGYSKGELVTGTIKSKAATTYTPGTSNQTIAAGQYLSGAQTIKGDANLTAANIAKGKSIFGVSGTYTSDANATAGNILKDKTAYVNGSKVTGTMTNLVNSIVESTSITQDATYTYLKIPQAGYYDSSSQVKVLNTTVGNSAPVQYVAPAGSTQEISAGDHDLLTYQIPKTGWYIVTANVRLSGFGDGSSYAIQHFLGVTDISSGTITNYNYSSGGNTMDTGWYELLLPVTMVAHVSAGGYFKTQIRTNGTVKIETSRMIMTLIKEG